MFTELWIAGLFAMYLYSIELIELHATGYSILMCVLQ